MEIFIGPPPLRSREKYVLNRHTGQMQGRWQDLAMARLETVPCLATTKPSKINLKITPDFAP